MGFVCFVIGFSRVEVVWNEDEDPQATPVLCLNIGSGFQLVRSMLLMQISTVRAGLPRLLLVQYSLCLVGPLTMNYFWRALRTHWIFTTQCNLRQKSLRSLRTRFTLPRRGVDLELAQRMDSKMRGLLGFASGSLTNPVAIFTQRIVSRFARSHVYQLQLCSFHHTILAVSTCFMFKRWPPALPHIWAHHEDRERNTNAKTWK